MFLTQIIDGHPIFCFCFLQESSNSTTNAFAAVPPIIDSSMSAPGVGPPVAMAAMPAMAPAMGFPPMMQQFSMPPPGFGAFGVVSKYLVS